MPSMERVARPTPPLGAVPLPGGVCSFAVWAPLAEGLVLELLPRTPSAPTRLVPLERHGEVLHATVDAVEPGDRYRFLFPDGRRRPDPRSRSQPDGVHGPSAVVDLARLRPEAPAPRDGPVGGWAIYELHVGTFTREGTFDAAIRELPHLVSLGVNAVELLPVAAFPGVHGWGYDGVHPFAVHGPYGGPVGLARFVDAAHRAGLAVILDVVYNHLGPDGNYLREFGPYFTDRHHTPWGDAVNFDGPGSEQVRRWAIENALQWIRDYRVDALRLDAVHAIADDSPKHVLAELAAAVQAEGGQVIAESDLNDPVVVRARSAGGWGHDAQWSDDLHHALHALLTRETNGYYADFGKASDLAAAYARGFVYDGSRMSPFRGRVHGRSAAGMPAEAHVVCLQNHDQIGNRARGERIAPLAGLARARLGAAACLLAPQVPLLFQGEEWAAPQPFPYFTDHEDEALGRAVSEGRKREFASFAWAGEVPDPQARETFVSAVLAPEDRERPPNAGMLALYRKLLALRRAHPALGGPDRGARTQATADDAAELVVLERFHGDARLAALLGFADVPREATVSLAPGRWRLVLDTEDPAFGGAGRAAPAELHVPPGGSVALRLPASAAWVYERA